MHTLISPIFFYKSCSVAILKHSKPLPLEIYVRIVALEPDLRKLSVYRVTEFSHHNSTIELANGCWS